MAATTNGGRGRTSTTKTRSRTKRTTRTKARTAGTAYKSKRTSASLQRGAKGLGGSGGFSVSAPALVAGFAFAFCVIALSFFLLARGFGLGGKRAAPRAGGGSHRRGAQGSKAAGRDRPQRNGTHRPRRARGGKPAKPRKNSQPELEPLLSMEEIRGGKLGESGGKEVDMELIRSQPGGNGSHLAGVSGSEGDPATATASPVSPVRSVGKCNRCQKEASLRCSRCKVVRYCTSECQVADWKAGHKSACRELALANGLAGKASAASSAGSSPAGKHRGDLLRTNATGASASEEGESSSETNDNILTRPERVLLPFQDFAQLYGDWDLENSNSEEVETVIEEIGSDSFACLSGPVGLRNVGNSCFANSVLQCLLHIEPFANYFLKSRHSEPASGAKGKRSSRGEWCPLSHTEQLVQSYYQHDKKVFSPRSFLLHIEDIGKHFCFGDQEDAHDFLVELLDSIQEALVVDAIGGKAAAKRLKREDPRSQETTLIWQIFGGHTRGEVNCDCGYVSKTFQGFLTLELQIPHGIRSLEGALEAFTQGEELSGDNQYKCDSCKQWRDAEQRTVVDIAPNVLMIALKRFSYFGFGKITTHVAFPETLDLAPYMAEDATDQDETEYSLYAVIVHISPFSSAGHYISFVRRGSQWFKCDDSSITAVSEKTVMSQNVYMLLYQRDVVKDHTSKGTKKVSKKQEEENEEAEASTSGSADTGNEDTREREKEEEEEEEEGGSSGALSRSDPPANANGVDPASSSAGQPDSAGEGQGEGEGERAADGASASSEEGSGEAGPSGSLKEDAAEATEGAARSGGGGIETPEYTKEEVTTAKGSKRLNVHVKLPEVDSQKEIDLRLSLSTLMLAVEGKYKLDLPVQLKSKKVKCKFVRKSKTLKVALDIV